MLTLNQPIRLDAESILSRIGYANDDRPSRRIAVLVDDYIENYNDFISPACSYVYRRIESIDGDRVDIGDGMVLKSRKLARALADGELVAVFAVTIGNYLEDMATQLAEDGLMVQATVLDAIGSGSVEKLAGIFEDHVREVATSAGMVISRRFSPGYCDWDVSQQEVIFRALNGDTAGIELTDSMLMMPRKSVSGIIGIGLPGKNTERYNPCETCFKKDCPGRRR